MKILFTGGGTLGPVTPLLAIAEELKRYTLHATRYTICWIGTRKGPERKLVEEAEISFSWIFAPKLRRYFDIRNFFAPLALHLATKIAWFKLLRMRPDVIVTAGGFVGVPVVWAGWWLRIPSVLHNQDVRWSLANRLVAPFVKRITYALPGTVPARWRHKAVWTGNPVRAFVFKGNKERGLKLCGFHDRVTTIMVVGGGTGAQRLNEIVVEALPELAKKYQVIHVTGMGKNAECRMQNAEVLNRYRAFEFVTSEMGDLLAAADLVITRAGMGFLTELAALGKPMIIISIPGSHQEDNARYFEKKGAAVVLDQRTLDSVALYAALDRMFADRAAMRDLSGHAQALCKSDASARVAREVATLAKR